MNAQIIGHRRHFNEVSVEDNSPGTTGCGVVTGSPGWGYHTTSVCTTPEEGPLSTRPPYPNLPRHSPVRVCTPYNLWGYPPKPSSWRVARLTCENLDTTPAFEKESPEEGRGRGKCPRSGRTVRRSWTTEGKQEVSETGVIRTGYRLGQNRRRGTL